MWRGVFNAVSLWLQDEKLTNLGGGRHTTNKWVPLLYGRGSESVLQGWKKSEKWFWRLRQCSFAPPPGRLRAKQTNELSGSEHAELLLHGYGLKRSNKNERKKHNGGRWIGGSKNNVTQGEERVWDDERTNPENKSTYFLNRLWIFALYSVGGFK